MRNTIITTVVSIFIVSVTLPQAFGSDFEIVDEIDDFSDERKVTTMGNRINMEDEGVMLFLDFLSLEEKGKPVLFMVATYLGPDFLFANYIDIRIDGEEMVTIGSSVNKKSEEDGYIIEQVIFETNKNFLEKIGNAKVVKVRVDLKAGVMENPGNASLFLNKVFNEDKGD